MNTPSASKRSAPEDPYLALRNAMRHATKPGSWKVTSSFDATSVSVPEGSKTKRIIFATTDGDSAQLEGYTELLYAVEAANAAPKLLQERHQLKEALQRLHSRVNMSGSHSAEGPPLSGWDMAKLVLDNLNDLIKDLQ